MKFLQRACCVIFIFAVFLVAQNLYGYVSGDAQDHSSENDVNSKLQGAGNDVNYMIKELGDDVNNILKELETDRAGVVEMGISRSKLRTCMQIIAKEKRYSEKQRIAALKQLGFMKEGSDAYILVDNLLLGYKGSIEFKELTKSNFPVGFALIMMGSSKPVRAALLAKIRFADDDEVIRLCAFVLMEIEDKDVAGFILKREIDKEKNDRQKTNLEMALSFLKK
ncbi:MAG: hypothetical protein KJ915_10400 [Candidatus Omnitrophica bacterium]|nr:hypothetical protein [Candidatus Omnitrophota bacterium]